MQDEFFAPCARSATMVNFSYSKFAPGEGGFMQRFLQFLLAISTIAVISGFLWIHHLEAEGLSRPDHGNKAVYNRIASTGIPSSLNIGEEYLQAAVTLVRFYEQRAYRLAWNGENGPLPQIDTFLKILTEADREGLRPKDYHLEHIKALTQTIRHLQEQSKPLDVERLVDLDFLLTDAFLLYASHTWSGRIAPATIHKGWYLERQNQEIDLVAVLQSALETGNIVESLQALLPSHPVYYKLREALVRYRELAAAGGWSFVPNGSKMQKGDQNERVALLRARLIASGDLLDGSRSEREKTFFDEGLEEAVRRFQQRHGLEVDGIVGPATLAELNIPIEERVQQIELNMERWRGFPRNFGSRYLLVNIANFSLEVMEKDQPILTMRTIVGRTYRRTPVFSAPMSYLVLSPYWHVPRRIAIQDKLPLIQKDPEYLAKQRIRVFQGQEEIDPSTVDWSTVTAEDFPYRLQQSPGSHNALGQVKFMFPNRFNVYLHDTPSRRLFQERVRAFSSGCIRIEKPLELADYLLRDDPTWTREKILAVMEKGRERVVHLSEPVPVYLLYWTAWADPDDTLQFRQDLYGWDKALSKALQREIPLSWQVAKMK